MSENQSGDTLSDSAVGWMILGVVFIALGWLVWFYFEYEIKNGVRWIRYSEMKAVSYFVPDDYTINWMGREIPYKETVKDVPNIPTYCSTSRNPDGLGYCLNGTTMSLISALAMEPMRWVLIAILGAMGIWAYQYGPKTSYRKKMDLDSLLTHQARYFSVIAPFVKFNPANQPPRPPGSPVPAKLPLFAEALGPEEWIAYHSIPVPDGEMDEDAAFAAFARQLGPPWRGAVRLPPYKQVLLASFCLKAARKRVEADTMLGDLALCWSPDRGLRVNKKLLKQARSVLANRDMASAVLSVCNQHAFQTTALIRGLAYAREEGGVLSPSQFVWLRGYDRELWYPLNNLGRQAFHMEALGAMSHYKIEKLTRRPMPRPKVEDAVQSISEYMSSLKARPIPQLDYSAAGKKSGKKSGKSAGIKQVGGADIRRNKSDKKGA